MLNNLSPLVKKKQRVGRGGKRGGTSGKGHKGQKARTGGASKIRSTFEGGQSPLVRRLPKRGFSNTEFSQPKAIVNIDQLERCFEDQAVIDLIALHNEGLIKATKRVFVKVLGKGVISKKFTIHAHAFSDSVKKAVEQQGGACIVVEGAK